MSNKKSAAYKKVPKYWWDFASDNSIIVESDDYRFPCVGKFYYTEHANLAIERAETLIDDLNAGRVSPRKVQ